MINVLEMNLEATYRHKSECHLSFKVYDVISQHRFSFVILHNLTYHPAECKIEDLFYVRKGLIKTSLLDFHISRENIYLYICTER